MKNMCRHISLHIKNDSWLQRKCIIRPTFTENRCHRPHNSRKWDLVACEHAMTNEITERNHRIFMESIFRPTSPLLGETVYKNHNVRAHRATKAEKGLIEISTISGNNNSGLFTISNIFSSRWPNIVFQTYLKGE